jgi:hypothetical protein
MGKLNKKKRFLHSPSSANQPMLEQVLPDAETRLLETGKHRKYTTHSKAMLTALGVWFN